MADSRLEGRIGQAYPITRPTVPNRANVGMGTPISSPFADVLQQTQQKSELRFSAHAAARLSERGVTLTQDDLRRIGQAVDLAHQKGVRDAYLVYQSSGFVVNVPNRTVVTAMQNQPSTVVTNVDGVVFV